MLNDIQIYYLRSCYGTSTRTTRRVLVRIERSVGLSTISRPAITGVEGDSEASPLAKIRSSQNNSPCFPKLLHNGRIGWYFGSNECVGSSCVVHFVICGNLDQEVSAQRESDGHEEMGIKKL
jgi:hypothetical protein